MMTKFTAIADADDEWLSLSDEWKAVSVPVDVDALRRRVRKQSRRMRLMLGLEVLVTLGAVAMLIWGARVADTWEAWLVIAGLTLFSVVTWAFNVRNRRGTWLAAAESLEAYHALELVRRRRRLAAATFTRRMSLFGLVPLAVLTIVRWRAMEGSGSPLGLVVCVAAMAYLVAWWAVARRLERTLQSAT
jgi:hypothetical protein